MVVVIVVNGCNWSSFICGLSYEGHTVLFPNSTLWPCLLRTGCKFCSGLIQGQRIMI